jgi:hypothetical protein
MKQSRDEETEEIIVVVIVKNTHQRTRLRERKEMNL